VQYLKHFFSLFWGLFLVYNSAMFKRHTEGCETVWNFILQSSLYFNGVALSNFACPSPPPPPIPRSSPLPDDRDGGSRSKSGRRLPQPPPTSPQSTLDDDVVDVMAAAVEGAGCGKQ
jgi:hypothetical protein